MIGGQRSAVPRFGLLLPVMGLIAALVISVFAVAWLAAEAQDRQAVSAMRHTVRSVIDGNRRELGRWASDYAYWDDFVEHVVVTSDPIWINDNIGLYAQENLGVDITLVVDGANEPYVMSIAEDLHVDEPLLTLPQGLVNLAKAARASAGPLEQRPIPQQTYVLLGDTLFIAAAAVAKWEDLPALPVRKGGPAVLMYLRHVDTTLLDGFSADYMIRGLALVPASEVSPDGLALTGLDGRIVAGLVWENPQPGTQFLSDLTIPMIIILAVAVLALLWIVVRVRAVFDQLAAAHVALNQRTEALRIARDEADRANRTKTQFLAQMSHDLRTPLNAILGFSEVIALQTFGSDAKAFVRYRDYAHQIHTGGDHLRSLIDSILDIARLDSGRYELHGETVFLDEAIETCLALLKVTLERKAFRVTAPASGLSVWADPNALEQILLNLVGNAAKYTAPGGEISIEATRAPGGVAIAIRDTGRGMSEADVASAFELFTRGEATEASTADGAGIGLSIVKRLIDLHDGTVEIKSARNVGTVVTFVLPDHTDVPVPPESLLGVA